MFGRTSAGGGRRIKIIDLEIIDFMKAQDFKKTDGAVSALFGISYNTWRKIERSEPVRYSLASRLERRVTELRRSQRGNRQASLRDAQPQAPGASAETASLTDVSSRRRSTA